MPAVPQIQLVGKILPTSLPVEWSCHCCDFRLRAMSEGALEAALDAHAAYVNATKDPATDPHFAEIRLNALLT